MSEQRMSTLFIYLPRCTIDALDEKLSDDTVPEKNWVS